MFIYIAHSYGKRHNESKEVYTENAIKSIDWGIEVAKLGHIPFIPNLYHYVQEQWAERDGAGQGENFWFDLVSAFVAKCDSLFVAEMPLWTNSGVEKEIVIALKLGKPVYYHLKDIPEEVGK